MQRNITKFFLLYILTTLPIQANNKAAAKEEESGPTTKPENAVAGMKHYKQIYSLEDEFIGVIKDRMLEVKEMKHSVMPAQTEIGRNLDRAINVLEAWSSANDYVPI